ncbi:putative BadF/BadG/BcrA/BcrD ATPase family protein [Actinoplanes missouriensis 431]|uniref:Putative BadF/BadG/BcrA/BcrD ATPase family protein n=1 Tax=Actinoplanes missouriensis (strain ATCC 14538 / DSM 43046 / CBS 188.64 / JCM 3121 / NBRC 102363 / NCIMB 12654 / NRRL B-3342 / UNCC 431) TaxID=512565 RepID=I0H3I6_ACTM4|nr:BadF/BadG/BcrA/BcrD ATPase family protein [Actinoplanes missouriensis]BAL87573.1 putative BadF/BadG/BcrA/BcrD ATPase family protein [Actinoplanes missouriensis 431]
MDLVVGVDAGGTASRAVVATLSGRVIGRGRAGPGNPVSAGPDAVPAIAAAIREALTGVDPGAVTAGVLGLAGTSACADPAFTTALDRAWAAAGLTGPWRVVGDAVTAFAAGTDAPSGAVLIAGTGAVAAEIQDHSCVRVTDGLGWLLGDLGSGHWLGLAALRAAVRSWSSEFAVAVAAATGVPDRDRLIHWAQRLPHAEIAGLAPLVCAWARAADPHAVSIVDEAVGHLVTTLGELGPAGPVVLAGSLLTNDTPVRGGVLGALRSRGVAALTSRDPAAAAAWLAMAARSPDAHAALLGLHSRA